MVCIYYYVYKNMYFCKKLKGNTGILTSTIFEYKRKKAFIHFFNGNLEKLI